MNPQPIISTKILPRSRPKSNRCKTQKETQLQTQTAEQTACAECNGAHLADEPKACTGGNATVRHENISGRMRHSDDSGETIANQTTTPKEPSTHGNLPAATDNKTTWQLDFENGSDGDGRDSGKPKSHHRRE